MKFNTEKNLRIMNELVAFFLNLGCTNIHIDLSINDNTSHFLLTGNISNLKDKNFNILKDSLCVPRQHEIEEYYWNLIGENETGSQISLVGMMIDKCNISFEKNILRLEIYRNDND